MPLLPRTPALLWSVLALMLLSVLLRALPFFVGTYPTGADYGHHILFAEQFISSGRLPSLIPYFQLGTTEWSVLPGANVLYALIAFASGATALNALPLTLIFAAVETAGVYLLAGRIFRSPQSALIAALIVAALPAGADMMSWAGYPNFIALALMPYVLLAMLNYWHRPTVRSLILSALSTVGMMSIHHLSTLWIVATLFLFAVVHLVIQPALSLKKLLPLGALGIVLGLPVAIAILNLTRVTSAGDVLLAADRFEYSRIMLSDWSFTVTTASSLFLTGGLLALLFNRQLHISDRVLIAAYAVVCAAFAFGWLVGLRFFYTRALFFLPLVAALGAAAMISAWRGVWLRGLIAASVVIMIGMGSITRVQFSVEYYQTLTPRVLDGAAWLRENSQPDDVVVVGTWWGFHMTRLLERPTLVALTPDLVGNPQELPIAADAVSVLMGLENIDAVMAAHDVRFVIVKARSPDIPDPERARQVMNAHPQMRLVYRNLDILIYERVS